MEPRCYRVCGFQIASSERELLLFEPLDDAFFCGIGHCPLDSLFPVRKDLWFVHQIQMTGFESLGRIYILLKILRPALNRQFTPVQVYGIWFSVDIWHHRGSVCSRLRTLY